MHRVARVGLIVILVAALVAVLGLPFLGTASNATEPAAPATDWGTGKLTPMTTAAYLCGLDEKTGRPTVKAFADRAAAATARKVAGGSLVGYAPSGDSMPDSKSIFA